MIRAGGAKGAFASGIDRPGRGTDFWLLLSAGLLLCIGLASIHSVDIARPGNNFMVKQMVWTAIGLLVFMGCTTMTPRFLERASPYLYGASILSLLAVRFFGDTKKGATRWIDIGPLQFQPSEVAKVILIITMAVYFQKRWEERQELRTFLGSLLHAAPIVILVLLQPHLAGAVSLGVIWLLVCAYANVPWKYLAATGAIVACLGFIAVKTPGIMPSYMRDRLEAKVRPDAKSNDWQQQRAKIAFGVGGVTGAGYLKGEQKAARYIPEQQNDFIFTVIGEELGLIGSTLTILLFGFFFFRVWLVSYRASEPLGRMMAAGVLAVLGFHTIVNLGMNVGILPVAGLWLPFVSYGGTALWACLACVGLLANVK